MKVENTNCATPIPGIAQLVESYRPSETDQNIYPVMDVRGSITKWVKADGTEVAWRVYDAFGVVLNSGGTWPSRFGYQGQAWIEMAGGLMLSPTRLYDVHNGRFIEADPLDAYLAILARSQYFVSKGRGQWSRVFTAPYAITIGSADFLGVTPELFDVWNEETRGAEAAKRRSLYQYGPNSGSMAPDPVGFGLVEWILTGEWDPSQEVLDAGSRGWLEGYGINPFNPSQSFGQWAYTGESDAADQVVEAAVQGGREGASKAWDCYKRCMCELNKAGLAAVAGAGGVAPYVPFPKNWLYPFLGDKMLEAYLASGRFGMGISGAGVVAQENGWTRLRETLFEHRNNFKRGWGRAGFRRWRAVSAAYAKAAATAIIAAEATASIYCSAKCQK